MPSCFFSAIRFWTFTISSLVSSVVEIALVFLFNLLLNNLLAGIALSMVFIFALTKEKKEA